MVNEQSNLRFAVLSALSALCRLVWFFHFSDYKGCRIFRHERGLQTKFRSCAVGGNLRKLSNLAVLFALPSELK